MSWDYDEDDLLELIGELEYADADSWLSCALLELAVDYLAEHEELHTEVGAALASAVRTLQQCAQQLEEEAGREHVQLQDLVRLTRAHQSMVGYAVDGLVRAWPSSPTQRCARELAVAACLLRTEDVGRAVTHLEAAIEAGATDPVAYLALGCLRYRQAIEQFAPVDKLDDRGVLRFQLACLRAVSALEQGLGGDIDVHLHWWIAVTLEAAGFSGAAADAWRRYEAAAQDESAPDEEEEEELAERRLPEISADEERQVSEALKDPDSLQQLLDGADEQPPSSEEN